jgi:signal transduction histidine kinase
VLDCFTTSLSGAVPRRLAWSRLGWLLFLACSLLICADHAWSQPATQTHSASHDHILKRAFWEDTRNQASLDTARQQTYTAYTGIFSRGYGDSTHWIRLTIAASTEPLGLYITPVWLDSITLYDPTDPRASVTVGDRHPAQNSVLPGLGHSFKLAASSVPRDIWLKLQSTSSHLLSVKVIPIDQMVLTSTRQTIWATWYTATLAMILFVLLAMWRLQPDRVLGSYLLRHAVYTYYAAAFLGLPTMLLSDWLPPAFFDQAFSISSTLVVPLATWFDLQFLSGYRPHKRWLAILKIYGVLSFSALLLLLSGHTSLALEINIYILMLGIVIVMLTALSCKSELSTEQVVPKKVMLSYYLLISTALLMGLSGILGLIRSTEWTLYMLILHGLVTGLMMSTILGVRTRRMAKKSLQMGWQIEKAQRDMELAQRRREDQSQFLHMLMHELKTPLAIVSLALGTKNHREENLQHAGRAVQDMKAIIDRCVQADQLGQMAIALRQEYVDVHALIQQLGRNMALHEQRLRVAAPDLPCLHTDRQLLQIILTNLLDNAARYSDPLTPIHLRIETTGASTDLAGLRIFVSNTPGLAGWPETEQLFTKYYRAVGAQRESGSGLGLFLARQLANSLGYTLEYAPSSQHVEFVLWIPMPPA